MLNASQHGTYSYIPFQHIVSYIISIIVVAIVIIIIIIITVSTASSVGELVSRKRSWNGRVM
jgi:hypothetical protein